MSRGLESQRLAYKNKRDSARPLKLVNDQLGDAAATYANTLHALIFERQGNLTRCTQPVIQSRGQLVQAGHPNHVWRAVGVKRLSAATPVRADGLTGLRACLKSSLAPRGRTGTRP